MQPSSISGNWLDLLIVAVFIFYAFEGYSTGLIRGAVDFLGFILSFVAALRLYGVTGTFLTKQFSLTHGIANAIGFFATAFISEILLAILLTTFLHAISGKFSVAKRLNRILGIIPGIATSIVLLSFFLSLVISLPFSPALKALVSNSKIASYLTVQSLGVEKTVNKILGGAVSEALNFLTIEPRSDETVNLRFKLEKDAFNVDPESEQKMFSYINGERTKKGFKSLDSDRKLTELARNHAKDMFQRGYFSHVTPDGLSPFDRMANAGISFNVAGENLALAPNVDLAHKGLMESKGHRENILSSDFGRVGIGVIDGGVYGKMFVQEFTN